MMRFRFLLPALFLLASTACSDAAGDRYDVFLLIGQSNMAGRGTMVPADTMGVMQGVWLLNAEDRPEPAKSPFNRYSTIRKEIGMQQVCPGNGFAATLRAATGRPLLLVVNARGGSALEEWLPGTEYYREAVRRTREAMKYGELKAVLWHQGESDTAHPETYLSRLAQLVDSLRADLGHPEVPFIAGEIARWRKVSEGFNAQIRRIETVIPFSGYVSSEGCTQLFDETDPHFSRDGQLLLGRRYAEKVMEMCYE